MVQTDSFHRLMKLLTDSGEASTMAEAIAKFSQYGVRVTLGDDVMGSAALQMIALTVINTAARSFQGNVEIHGNRDIKLAVHGFEGTKLSDFIEWAGLTNSFTNSNHWPEICISKVPKQKSGSSLSPWASGWTFGLGECEAFSTDTFAPACVAAGALAVSEAFSILRKDSPYAGRRKFSFSLWSMKSDAAQPPTGTTAGLEEGLWLVGLGHLGQAYCWTLGMMRQQKPVTLVLQDIDTVTESTITTSVLSSPQDIKRLKTRTVAEWMERRGFTTRLVERRFDGSTRVSAIEPHWALFGVDNPSARRMCEGAGFTTILDGGLGSGYDDFRALRVRAFPGSSSAAAIWAADTVQRKTPLAPAYEAMVASGEDPCGVTTLATRSVGAPFVGCYAAALVVAELIRRREGEQGYDVIDLNLRSPGRLEVA